MIRATASAELLIIAAASRSEKDDEADIGMNGIKATRLAKLIWEISLRRVSGLVLATLVFGNQVGEAGATTVDDTDGMNDNVPVVPLILLISVYALVLGSAHQRVPRALCTSVYQRVNVVAVRPALGLQLSPAIPPAPAQTPSSTRAMQARLPACRPSTASSSALLTAASEVPATPGGTRNLAETPMPSPKPAATSSRSSPRRQRSQTPTPTRTALAPDLPPHRAQPHWGPPGHTGANPHTPILHLSARSLFLARPAATPLDRSTKSAKPSPWQPSQRRKGCTPRRPIAFATQPCSQQPGRKEERLHQFLRNPIWDAEPRRYPHSSIQTGFHPPQADANHGKAHGRGRNKDPHLATNRHHTSTSRASIRTYHRSLHHPFLSSSTSPEVCRHSPHPDNPNTGSRTARIPHSTCCTSSSTGRICPSHPRNSSYHRTSRCSHQPIAAPCQNTPYQKYGNDVPVPQHMRYLPDPAPYQQPQANVQQQPCLSQQQPLQQPPHPPPPHLAGNLAPNSWPQSVPIPMPMAHMPQQPHQPFPPPPFPLLAPQPLPHQSPPLHYLHLPVPHQSTPSPLQGTLPQPDYDPNDPPPVHNWAITNFGRQSPMQAPGYPGGAADGPPPPGPFYPGTPGRLPPQGHYFVPVPPPPLQAVKVKRELTPAPPPPRRGGRAPSTPPTPPQPRRRRRDSPRRRSRSPTRSHRRGRSDHSPSSHRTRPSPPADRDRAHTAILSHIATRRRRQTHAASSPAGSDRSSSSPQPPQPQSQPRVSHRNSPSPPPELPVPAAPPQQPYIQPQPAAKPQRPPPADHVYPSEILQGGIRRTTPQRSAA